ncbi:unnamed protein product (macronuclear) [Paramecium tetraurelia]|uniref:Uncharacterized protein n=2 Tax=Paramecium TaxID=5884 RepID=A0C399_PARTE|nr:uncharacterized protein GSPATT00034745001 [Paramecium tetraurelia]CAD8211897.1 unnamed protein product [Paramecium octaurelia]CAK65266.1 unnamed protein product [Paramecium tetraurelia]|eukprot:XP_001432663.1 hypothetical protein (macronuclear) [Paramecium tetraurelia strain d4-2]
MNQNCYNDESVTIWSDKTDICEEAQTVKRTEIYQQRLSFLVIETSNDELSYRNLLKFKCALAKRIKKART